MTELKLNLGRAQMTIEASVFGYMLNAKTKIGREIANLVWIVVRVLEMGTGPLEDVVGATRERDANE